MSCENERERRTWLSHLRIRKQEIIKEQLGHKEKRVCTIQINQIIAKKYENRWNFSGGEAEGRRGGGDIGRENNLEGNIEMQNLVMAPCL